MLVIFKYEPQETVPNEKKQRLFSLFQLEVEGSIERGFEITKQLPVTDKIFIQPIATLTPKVTLYKGLLRFLKEIGMIAKYARLNMFSFDVKNSDHMLVSSRTSNRPLFLFVKTEV